MTLPYHTPPFTVPSASESSFSIPTTFEPVFSVATTEPAFESQTSHFAQPSQNTQPQFQQYNSTTVSSSNAKFPYLKKDEYETWAIKMEYWIMNSDHNLWNIVLHGNNRKQTGRDPRGNIMILPPYTMCWSQLNHIHARPDNETEMQTYKTLEIDVKGGSSYDSRVPAAPTHSAFISAASTNSKWSTDSKCQPSSVSYTTTSSSADASGNVLENVLHSFVAESDPQQQITYEDFFDQISRKKVDSKTSNATDAETQFALMGLSPQFFDSSLKDAIEKPLYDWFVKPVGMHAVPPPITGTFMPPSNKPDIDDTTILPMVQSPIIVLKLLLFSRPGLNTKWIGGGRWGDSVKTSTVVLGNDNPHTNKNLGIVDSGCSRSMTGVDNGTEFKNSNLIELCGSKGIKRDYSVARTLQQNRVVERKNRTLIEAARTMLADSKLPTMFLTEAVSTACYVLNRVLVTRPHNKTPYELLSGKVPNISYTSLQIYINLQVPSHTASANSEITYTDYADETFGVPATSIPLVVFESAASVLSRHWLKWKILQNCPLHSYLANHISSSSEMEGIHHHPTTGIFSESTYDADFGGSFTNLAPTIAVDHVPTRRKSKFGECALAGYVHYANKGTINRLSSIVLMCGSLFFAEGKTAIGTKWILKNKRDARGIVVRNKARLVAQGHRQEEGIHYDESAFLYGEIDEEVYVTQPKVCLKDPFYPKHVYKFVKALYVLIQATKAWSMWITIDILGQQTRLVTEFLGLQVKQQPDGIFISQEKYVQDMHSRSDMERLQGQILCSAVSAYSRHQVTPLTSNLNAHYMILIKLCSNGDSNPQLVMQFLGRRMISCGSAKSEQPLHHTVSPRDHGSPSPRPTPTTPVAPLNEPVLKPPRPIPTSPSAQVNQQGHHLSRPCQYDSIQRTMIQFLTLMWHMIPWEDLSLLLLLGPLQLHLKDVLGKLVKRVKFLESKLKARGRNVILSESDNEEDEEQDVDSLIKLAKAAAIAADTSSVPADATQATGFPPSSSIHTDVPTGTASDFSADPSNKGKSPMVEEDPPIKERSFRQMEEDRLGAEAARKLYEEEQAELARVQEEMKKKRQEDVINSAKYYNDADWSDIMGQVHANKGLTADLLGPDVNEDNFAARMAAIIAERRRKFAAQRFQDKRNKPLTYAQHELYETFVKTKAPTIYTTCLEWTLKHVRSFSDDQLKDEFDKIRHALANLQSQHLRRSLKRQGADLEQPDSKKSKSTEPQKTYVPAASRPSSAGVTSAIGESLATRKMPSSEVDLNAPDTSFIKVLSDDDSDDSDDDSDPLFWHIFAAWEVIPTGLGDVNALYFTDKTSKYLLILKRILHWFDRQDRPKSGLSNSWKLFPFSGVHMLETFTGKILYMFADTPYPLSALLMKKMLKHKLEVEIDGVGNDMTYAVQLI
ncbi:anticodon-binding aminoacyl-tRNA synthetase, class 1a [Tanacetum coccineum]